MKPIPYKKPELSEVLFELCAGFASSVDGSIDNVTEETGTWD